MSPSDKSKKVKAIPKKLNNRENHYDSNLPLVSSERLFKLFITSGVVQLYETTLRGFLESRQFERSSSRELSAELPIVNR